MNCTYDYDHFCIKMYSFNQNFPIPSLLIELFPILLFIIYLFYKLNITIKILKNTKSLLTGMLF